MSLPTDRTVESELLPEPSPGPPELDLARLMRPRWSVGAEWEPASDGIALGNYDVRVVMPTYPLYGPPPPFLSLGFSYTDLRAPTPLDLPSSLYDVTLGGSWMRPIHDRWMVRVMLSGAFASDGENTGTDAWQLRGGLFATYQWNPELQILVGAFASGRDDIPVLPGLGAIWRPTPDWHLDLMMPRPRISYRLPNDGEREYWAFLAAGLSGGTWACTSGGRDDRLTYREWRIGIGLESSPPKRFPPLPGDGITFEGELAYVLGREFEFETRPDTISFADTLIVRVTTSF